MSYLLYVVLVFWVSNCVNAEDIVGCGGFVKLGTHDKERTPVLDLTQIKIKLMTDDGLVKYTTEPAPNGYYMIPVYEKGKYRVQIQPKSGWNFAPSAPVDLDLEACERNEDVDFVFTGFEVSGQVLNDGTDYGPSGVKVVLTSTGKDVQITITADGRYKFTSVLSGEYSIQASHDSLLFSKAEVKVVVNDDALEVKDGLIVHGYSVTGRITNEEQPVKGVSFVLSSLSGKAVDVKGCTMGAPAHYSQKNAICHVVSDEKGNFVFKSVPVGKYNLVPFHRGERTLFDVVPAQVTVDVVNADVVIETQFIVSGFGVHGQVKYSTEGKPVAGAQVSLNGNQVATTDSQGMYAIDGMKAGMYSITVHAPSLHFDVLKVKVAPSEPLLPKIVPSRYDLCGKVVMENLKVQGTSISIADASHPERQQVVTVEDGGLFCAAVRAGTYIVKPVASAANKFTLAPASIKVQVTDAPLADESVKFSLFKAVLSGKVECLSSCGDLEVMLRSPADPQASPKTQKVKSSSTSAAFVFQGVLPGEYTVSAVRPSWCWEDNSKHISVQDVDVSEVVLKQKGFAVTVESSHALNVQCSEKKKMSSNEKNEAVKSIEYSLSPGANDLCIPSSGTFEMVPQSCHTFDKTAYIFDTNTAQAITINVLKHKVSVVLTSEQNVQDVSLTLRIGDQTSEVKMPPTEPSGREYVSKIDQEVDVSITELSISPRSSLVLFKQELYQVTINRDNCPAAEVTIQASRGEFVEGGVSPPIAGLNIKVLNGEVVVDEKVTDSHGKYRFGPLPAGVKYSVTAEKHGYILDRDEKNPYNFEVFKLAEVLVHVKGADGGGLPGVILSLSGQTYRSNNRTDEDGRFSFLGLSPGTYYLKAILKEYEFSPMSVDVKEGVTQELIVPGKRVAYSCLGTVVNLKSEPVSCRVLVKAQGVKGDDCVNTEESSLAEADGRFRVRGLKPGCSYRLRLSVDDTKETNPSALYRISPQFINVDMSGADMHVGKFTVAQGLALTDVAVFIQAPEHLTTLKVVLAKDGSPLHVISTSNSNVIYFNSIPMDSAKYRVYLETSLSKKMYEYELEEQVFQADVPSKVLTFTFTPKVRSQADYEVRESSVLALIIVALTALVVLNKQLCQESLTKVINAITKKQR